MLFHLRPGEGEGGRGPALPLLSYWVAGRLFPAPHPRECYVCYHDSSPQVSRSLLVCIPFGWRDVCSWPSHLLLHDHTVATGQNCSIGWRDVCSYFVRHLWELWRHVLNVFLVFYKNIFHHFRGWWNWPSGWPLVFISEQKLVQLW